MKLLQNLNSSIITLFLLLSSQQLAYSQYTAIPDPIFEQELINFNIDSEGTLDGQILTADAAAQLWLNMNNKGINDMTGIEAFTNLLDLQCVLNNLTSLNISTLSSLTNLNAWGNDLTDLDLTGNTSLESADVRFNEITSLDVTGLSNLEILNCKSNNITNLNASSCSNLIELTCNANGMLTLEVANLNNLQTLIANSNALTTIDLSGLSSLESLNCFNNLTITSLDVSNLTNLISLNCSFNEITTLDVSNLTALENLSCTANNIEILDVSNLTALENLECSSNAIEVLNFINAPNLLTLDCKNNEIFVLDLSSANSMIDYDLRNNSLAFLDIKNGNNTNITDFFATVNSNLCCISVDDPAWAEVNLTNVDQGVDFEQVCPSCGNTIPTKTLSGTVEHPNGAVQYSFMSVFDAVTNELAYSGNVCIGGTSFSIELVPGTYDVYYRPYLNYALSYETMNVTITDDLDMTFVLTPYTNPDFIDSTFYSKDIVLAGTESYFFEVEIDNTFSFDSLFIYNETAITYEDGIQIGKFKLLDDGQGNDSQAGDFIFTSNDLIKELGSGARSGVIETNAHVHCQGYDNNIEYRGRVVNATAISCVDANATTIQPLIQVNDSVFINDYLINHVTTNPFYQPIVYDVFLDTFDFISIFTPSKNNFTNTHQTISNNVSGIGKSIYSNSLNFGSQGKLKGLSRYPNNLNKPPMNHEVSHQWGASIAEFFNTIEFGSHYGYSSVYGLLGGVGPELSVINSNTVSYDVSAPYGLADGAAVYADLELYSMGVLDTMDLRDSFIVLTNPVLQSGNNYTVDAIDYVTPQDIVLEYGYRSPAPVDTVKIFRTATVVATTQPMTEAENLFYTYLAKVWEGSQAENFYNSFDEAALMKADMITLLPAAKYGCTDPLAHNYVPYADIDDGTCETCTDNILNGDETATDCGGDFCDLCTVLGGDCPTILNLHSETIITGLYKAENELYSPNLLNGNLNIQYQSGLDITLEEGFYLPKTTNFEVMIKNCIPD